MLLAFEGFAVVVGIPGLVVLLAILWRQKRSPAYLLCFSIFWVYLLIVAGVTIFPVPLSGALVGRQPAAHILSRVNLVPFEFGKLFDLHSNVIFRELIGNILLTVPFGFGISFIAWVRGKQFPWLAIAVGLAIETTQLLVSLGIGGVYRGVDINDVLLNAGGVLAGYGFFRAIAGILYG